MHPSGGVAKMFMESQWKLSFKKHRNWDTKWTHASQWQVKRGTTGTRIRLWKCKKDMSISYIFILCNILCVCGSLLLAFDFDSSWPNWRQKSKQAERRRKEKSYCPRAIKRVMNGWLQWAAGAWQMSKLLAGPSCKLGNWLALKDWATFGAMATGLLAPLWRVTRACQFKIFRNFIHHPPLLLCPFVPWDQGPRKKETK